MCLFGAKPLPEPMLSNYFACEKTSVELNDTQILIQEKSTQIIIIIVDYDIFWNAICHPGCSYASKFIQQIKLPPFFLAVVEIGAPRTPFVQPCSVFMSTNALKYAGTEFMCVKSQHWLVRQGSRAIYRLTGSTSFFLISGLCQACGNSSVLSVKLMELPQACIKLSKMWPSYVWFCCRTLSHVLHNESVLIYFGLVTPYSVIDLCQLWLR